MADGLGEKIRLRLLVASSRGRKRPDLNSTLGFGAEQDPRTICLYTSSSRTLP